MKMIFKFEVIFMGQVRHYNTKQRQVIADYLEANRDKPVTAAQISEHCSQQGAPVGVTTIYRQLERLIAAGEVKRMTIEGMAGACYQYIGTTADSSSRFHLKCEDCGQLIDLHCGYIDNLYSHINNEHQFAVDSLKTVLYGKCASCSAEEGTEKHARKAN